MNNLSHEKTLEILYNILTDILKLKSVEITDDFFELGGTSLAITLIIFRIKEEFGVILDPTIFFESSASIIKALAKEISKLKLENNLLDTPNSTCNLKSNEGEIIL